MDGELPTIRPMAWGSPAEPAESHQQMLGRVRRRVAAAATRGGKSWEDLFTLSDKNRDGALELKEVDYLVRKELRVPCTTICDSELRALFNAVDKDGSGNVDSAELIEYIQHGPRRPQDDAASHELRIQRVRRNMRLAFQSIGGNELDARKIFNFIDSDGSSRLSMYEFETFVRDHLGLTRWDVKSSALAEFFCHLDANGDGLDVNELLAFLRSQHKEKASMGPQSLYIAPKATPVDRKRKTYKQQLECSKGSSLGRSGSLPVLRSPSASFTNLGRTRLPPSRD